jgi:hypothetical protein
MLSEGLFELNVEVFADFGLRSRLFVDPETNLIREILIVETGWKHCLLDDVKLDFLCPLIGREVTVNLVS